MFLIKPTSNPNHQISASPHPSSEGTPEVDQNHAAILPCYRSTPHPSHGKGDPIVSSIHRFNPLSCTKIGITRRVCVGSGPDLDWMEPRGPAESAHASQATSGSMRVLPDCPYLRLTLVMTASELQSTFSQPAAPGGPPVRPLSPILLSSEDEGCDHPRVGTPDCYASQPCEVGGCDQVCGLNSAPPARFH